ncbi:hypothetical protein [Lacimicrobium sp. SS2-24]|uniref:hypothetical protein n=1 Tax=Lacimicrobium sp. SS2-24 TaxID=2005569 RepID=UPI00143CB57C|nr:hypothetical protein [Lacimicrobium sp. SS2-24]
MTTGCQLLSKGSTAPVEEVSNASRGASVDTQASLPPEDFGQYYLWLKDQSVQMLEQEVERRRKGQRQGDADDMLRLVLLYSLPNSPVKNPHQARTELRRLFNQPQVEVPGSFYALFDQLTENIKYQRQLLEVSESLDQVMSEKQSLERQLQQLKLIEQNILKRDTDNNGN